MNKPGPEPVYAPEVAAARRREQRAREQLTTRGVARYIRKHHPKIYAKAREVVEAEIAAEHGKLPGG